VKSANKTVLLYGCETWLVTSEILCKIQAFLNRSLRYILIIWWPKTISNKDLQKATGQEDVNLEIRKRKFRRIGHTLKKTVGNIKGHLTMEPSGKQEERKTKKQLEKIGYQKSGEKLE
jgi:hypothetical protein